MRAAVGLTVVARHDDRDVVRDAGEPLVEHTVEVADVLRVALGRDPVSVGLMVGGDEVHDEEVRMQGEQRPRVRERPVVEIHVDRDAFRVDARARQVLAVHLAPTTDRPPT